jgi:hypothetical protein
LAGTDCLATAFFGATAFLAGAVFLATAFLAGGAAFLAGATLWAAWAAGADFLAELEMVTVAFLVGDLAVVALAGVALLADGAGFLAGVFEFSAADFLAGVALLAGVAFLAVGAVLAGVAFLALADDFFNAVNSTSFEDQPVAPGPAHRGTVGTALPTSASG